MTTGLQETSRLGWWSANGANPPDDGAVSPAGQTDLLSALRYINDPVTVVDEGGQLRVRRGGVTAFGAETAAGDGLPVLGYAPPVRLESLGDPGFRGDHGLQYAYLGGAMANGITSAQMVIALGKAGCMATFGAAGLSLEEIESAIDEVQSALPSGPYGFNLIHTPNEPAVEAAVVDLYLRRGVNRVSASAYLNLTLPVVRYRVHGIHRDADGQVVTPNRILAKVSRVEVASKFMAPPPRKLVDELVNRGELTTEQAECTQEIPMAQDIIAEADSGGHTDNRPAIALVPTMTALRDRLQEEHGYSQPLRIGAAGGIATPSSAAAAFAMGAAFVLTGSVNQACVESGSSDEVRQMLAEAQQADVIMAPAADMFELGVKLQVLKRGTMFPMRAARLYELYRSYDSLEALPPKERGWVERTVLRTSLEEAWRQTSEYWAQRDPAQNERAAKDPHHRMALVFRSYLGMSSRWANAGVADRKVDFQVWCGPAMGAFNEWARGSFLEQPENRRVATVALNLLYGAAVLSRVYTLSLQGVPMPADAWQVKPVTADELAQWTAG